MEEKSDLERLSCLLYRATMIHNSRSKWETLKPESVARNGLSRRRFLCNPITQLKEGVERVGVVWGFVCS